MRKEKIIGGERVEKLTKADLVKRSMEKILEKDEDIRIINYRKRPQERYLNQHDVKEFLEIFLNEIKKGILEDKIIELRGFGTFEVILRRVKKNSRNPRTGFPVEGKNHGVVMFRPGQNLKKSSYGMRK